VTTRTEICITFPLCGGTLTCWSKRYVSKAYDDAPVRQTKLWAVFEREGVEKKFRSAEELYRVLCAQGCDLRAEITPVAGNLAELTTFLMGRSRAIVGVQGFSFLEDYHPISLRDHLPRVEGHDFRFLVVAFPEGWSKPRVSGAIGLIDTSKSQLIEILIDLRTGAIRREPLYRTARTEPFVTIPLCGGSLTGWRKVDAADPTGDPIPKSVQWAVFQNAGVRTEFHSAEELYRFLSAQRCDLPADAARSAAELAQLTATLLGHFRAVTDLERDGFMEKQLDLSFSIREELPRVEGSMFRFIVVDLSIAYRRGCLFGIDIDLRTGAIKRPPRS
jgi:hypothetical protein